MCGCVKCVLFVCLCVCFRVSACFCLCLQPGVTRTSATDPNNKVVEPHLLLDKDPPLTTGIVSIVPVDPQLVKTSARRAKKMMQSELGEVTLNLVCLTTRTQSPSPFSKKTPFLQENPTSICEVWGQLASAPRLGSWDWTGDGALFFGRGKRVI